MIKRLKLMAIALLVVPSIFSFAVPASVHAVDVTSQFCANSDNKPVVCADATKAKTTDPAFGPNGAVTKSIRLLLVIVGIIAIFVILVNAVRMITSMGNPDSFNSAKNGLIFAAVGLVIIILAQTIITFIVRKV